MAVKGKNLRIAQEIREKIQAGVYPVGSKLESLAVLTKQFDTTVVTMSRALDVLENEGLIERVNGLGIFVKKRVNCRFALVFDSRAEMGFFAHKAVFVKYFIDHCHDKGYDFTIFENVDSERDCSRVRRQLLASSYDVILISSRRFAEGHEKYLRNITIAAIGLYAYKDLETCLHTDPVWTKQAYDHLLEQGCSKIAVITNNNQQEPWQHPGIERVEDIFYEYCNRHPGIFEHSQCCLTELTPRDGYQAACELLERLPKTEKIGLLVTDAVQTFGVISAVLQKQYDLWKDLYLISHSISGFNLAQFCVPVITCQFDMKQSIQKIEELVQEYFRTGTLRKGISYLTGKYEFPQNEQ